MSRKWTITSKIKPIYSRVFDNTYYLRSNWCKSIADRVGYYSYGTVDGQSFWHSIISERADTPESIDEIANYGDFDVDTAHLTDDLLIRTRTAIKRKHHTTSKEQGNKLMNLRTVSNYCKEKLSDRIKYRGMNLIDDTVEKIEKRAISYGMVTLKNAVGVEHVFTLHRDGSTTIKTVNDFVKKYDKNFIKHTVICKQEKGRRITNKQFIVLLDAVTFLYVAAGNALGEAEDRYLIYNSLSDIDLYIYIGGYNAQKYDNELCDMLEAVDNREALGIYQVTCNSCDSSRYNNDGSNRESLYITYSQMSPRNLDTLYFSNNEKEMVVEHLNRFNNHRDFYESRQILYKTGILLYGDPGTGKSSFVKALATKYGRSIINIDIANLQAIDLTSLAQSIMVDDKKNYIVLFEDIDTLFLNRTDSDTQASERAVINKLLQFLDSNSSPTNVIFVATTNHIERLDEALLREGRFDLKVEVKSLSRPEAELFGKSFELTDDVVNNILNTVDNEATEPGRYNQSKLQARLLACIENKSYEESVKLHCEM